MTCEVAVMNTRGIALAADSAVTMGNGQKVYNSAEKLFQLAPAAPVGIMTYGGGELMGVPWETVIAGYVRKIGNHRFDTLAEYAEDFVAFVEGARAMFPERVQSERLRHHVRALWQCLYAEPLKARSGRRRNGKDRNTLLLELINRDHEAWLDDPPLEGFGSDFADAALSDCGVMLDEVEAEIFGTTEQPAEIRERLRTTIRYFLTRGAFPGEDDSGLVVAGMGEAEHFPSLLHYRAGTITRNRLKLMRLHAASISHDDRAMVIPFGQHEAIDLIIEGIHPALARKLPALVEEWLHPRRRRWRPRQKLDCGGQEGLAALLKDETQESHSGPFMATVAALPRQDLAAMAESLVSLAAFRTRAAADERETVGGPIDVATLSKGAGFVWGSSLILAG